AESGSGTLTLVANGEDFVRQGFVTKDGWRIDFDHVYVTLNEVKAYQTEPAFDPQKDEQIEAKTEVTLVDTPETIDLAAGDADAAPITVTEETATAGAYNAIAWQLVSPEGDEVNSAIVLEGTAQKEGRSIDFVLNLDKPMAYKCGEYVGDARKGFLQADGATELETTFHFDHIFGDAEAPADDEINTGAVGFDPMAQLADNNRLNVDLATLQQELSTENYQTLEKAIKSLGHVGEGHCAETPT
ncbi:MAG: DUF4382 domain-containing protein, partial [Halothece sp. Uz-M2-17]|nr:DUF4382 domain-containing protein [Halothece sp. Uz-M2-17]